jgi:hypothetical protein
VQFLDIVVRQAHPGPDVPAYDTIGKKMFDARRYELEERIGWPVLVDDAEGSVHRTYGGLSDPAWLIGSDGRVSFYCMWTHAPTLHRAIEALMRQGGAGVVLGGWDRRPHMMAAIAHGWKGLRRGAPRSVVDMERALPGSAVVLWLGYQLRPALAPIALRSTPLPVAAKAGLAAGGAALLWLALRPRMHKENSYG